MSECNETPDRSLICTCPRMYAVCSSASRCVCSACAKREGGYRDRDQTRSTNSGSNFRIYPQQQGGSCVGAPAATRFSSLFILSGIFPTKRQKKKKWQERLCFEVVSPGEKLYCFDTGIQSEMMMTTRTTYIRG